MNRSEIKKFLDVNLHTFESPEVFTPEMNIIINDWNKEENRNKVKFCLTALTEYAAMISNLGFYILYDIMNNKMDNCLCERAYYPEPRLKRKMEKENIPLFSKETNTPLKEFDIIGFSSYFPMQMFAIPAMLELAGLEIHADKRKDSDPIIVMGGVAAFNPFPAHKFLDAVFLGDGEGQIEKAVTSYKELRDKGATKDEILLYWTNNVTGVFVPKWYGEDYYPADHPEKPNQIKSLFRLRDDVPKTIKRNIAEISKIEPPTKMFVPNSEGDDLSAGSLEIARGCADKCLYCFDGDTYVATPRGDIKIKDLKYGDTVFSVDTDGEIVIKRTHGAVSLGLKEVKKYSSGNKSVICTPDHKFANNNFDFIEVDKMYSEKISLYKIKSKENYNFVEDSFLVAVIAADFSLGVKSRYPVFSQNEHRPLINYFKSTYRANTEWVYENGTKVNIALRYTSGKIHDLARKVFGFCLSKDKNPNYIINDVDSAASYIFGLLGTDVSVRRNIRGSQVIFSSVSEKLNDFTATCLSILGIIYSKDIKNDRYVCSISRKEEILKLYSIQDNYKHIVDYKLLEVDTEIKQVKNYRFNTASKIELGLREVFDIYVEDTHNFIANGFVVHNCEGSYRSMPYRERPMEMVKPAFSELIKNTGAKTVTPYAFNISDYTKVNELIHFLVVDEGRRVSMSSQRIDRFDDDFAKAVFDSGNANLTIGLESGSSRVREKLSKNVSDEQVLETFRTAFKIGFRNIKVYMIASIPEETVEDVNALIDLVKRIREVQREVQGDTMFTRIKFSWTNFTAKAFTPLQWAKVHDIGEDGLPFVPKTLSGLLDFFDSIGYHFRLSTEIEISTLNQILSLADRRFCDIVEEVHKDKRFNYRGGMSMGVKNLSETMLPILKKYGFDYEYFMREKGRDEIFAWDIINMGVTKKFLHDSYWKNFKDGVELEQCYKSCERCGGCTSISKDLFKKFWNNEIEYSNKKYSDFKLKSQDTFKKIRLYFSVLDDFRYVHKSKIKAHIRRAFMKLGIDIKSDMSCVSDKIKLQDWYSGVDWAEVSVIDVVDVDELQKGLVGKLNNVVGGVDCPLVFIYADVFSHSANLVNEDFTIAYSLKLDSMFKYDKVLESLNIANNNPNFLFKLKVEGEVRDTFKTIEVKLHDYLVGELFCKNKEDGVYVYGKFRGRAGLYEVLPSVLKTLKRNIFRYPCRREYILQFEEEHETDMFDSYCIVCDRKIERNIFDEDISDSYCFKHLIQ